MDNISGAHPSSWINEEENVEPKKGLTYSNILEPKNEREREALLMEIEEEKKKIYSLLVEYYRLHPSSFIYSSLAELGQIDRLLEREFLSLKM